MRGRDLIMWSEGTYRYIHIATTRKNRAEGRFFEKLELCDFQFFMCVTHGEFVTFSWKTASNWFLKATNCWLYILSSYLYHLEQFIEICSLWVTLWFSICKIKSNNFFHLKYFCFHRNFLSVNFRHVEEPKMYPLAS